MEGSQGGNGTTPQPAIPRGSPLPGFPNHPLPSQPKNVRCASKKSSGVKSATQYTAPDMQRLFTLLFNSSDIIYLKINGRPQSTGQWQQKLCSYSAATYIGRKGPKRW